MRPSPFAQNEIARFDERFAGCIAGLHEVLRRQGLLEGIWCLDPAEGMGPGQSAEIDRVYRAYPHLNERALATLKCPPGRDNIVKAFKQVNAFEFEDELSAAGSRNDWCAVRAVHDEERVRGDGIPDHRSERHRARCRHLAHTNA